jgi:DNA modification methylase
VSKRDGNDGQNLLDGRTWTRYSISIWDDLRKSTEENNLEHPAVFPQQLVARVLEIFTRQSGERVLDPFCGSGTVLLSALAHGCSAVGVELSEEYIELAAGRLRELDSVAQTGEREFYLEPERDISARLVHGDARQLLEHVEPSSFELCVTSPPYWDILRQRRSADRKEIRDYEEDRGNLGSLEHYDAFLDSLQQVFSGVFSALKPNGMCVVVVMDLRKKADFFPLHADLIPRLESVGFTLDDIIIWDRRQEYNNLRPLGYPWVFRVNKVHEFVMFFQKRV